MCLCRVITQRDGNEADEYARGHLEQQSVDATSWTEIWACPRSAVKWLLDYPHGELQGGGPKRLRTFAAVSREVFLALGYIDDLLADDLDVRTAANDLRQRLETRYPGIDPTSAEGRWH